MVLMESMWMESAQTVSSLTAGSEDGTTTVRVKAIASLFWRKVKSFSASLRA